MERFLSTAQIARVCDAGRTSVREWLAGGVIPAKRLPTKRREYRVSEDDVYRWLTTMSHGLRYYGRAVWNFEREVGLPPPADGRGPRPPRRHADPRPSGATPHILSTSEVGEILGRNARSVRALIRSGALPARRKGIKGSLFRVTERALRDFLNGKRAAVTPRPSPGQRLPRAVSWRPPG